MSISTKIIFEYEYDFEGIQLLKCNSAFVALRKIKKLIDNTSSLTSDKIPLHEKTMEMLSDELETILSDEALNNLV